MARKEEAVPGLMMHVPPHVPVGGTLSCLSCYRGSILAQVHDSFGMGADGVEGLCKPKFANSMSGQLQVSGLFMLKGHTQNSSGLEI